MQVVPLLSQAEQLAEMLQAEHVVPFMKKPAEHVVHTLELEQLAQLDGQATQSPLLRPKPEPHCVHVNGMLLLQPVHPVEPIAHPGQEPAFR